MIDKNKNVPSDDLTKKRNVSFSNIDKKHLKKPSLLMAILPLAACGGGGGGSTTPGGTTPPAPTPAVPDYTEDPTNVFIASSNVNTVRHQMI